MSSERFEALDEELCGVLLAVENAYAEKLPLFRGEERDELIGDIQRKLDFATRAIFDMESEAHSAPPTFRYDMMQVVKKHRNSVQRISALVHRSKNSSKINYFESDQSNNSIEREARQAVLEGTSVLERTAESLTRATQAAVQTEEIGNQVINELGQQRESLTRTRERLHDTDVELTRSRRILRAMQFKILTNKFVLVLIILLESAILAGLIYYKFFK